MTVVKNLTWWDKFVNSLFGWRGFTVPVGEEIPCFKDRSEVKSVGGPVTWGNNTTITRRSDPGKVQSDGVGQGTPMQLGGDRMRTVTWGSGYGRFNQFTMQVPLPADGGRYWITGYPATAFDKRCIIHAGDETWELIQFDQDLGVLPAGFPQQALNMGRWQNGELVEGVAVTAAGRQGSAYVWGRGSAQNMHVQAMTVQDYRGGDGTSGFPEQWPDGVMCGDWLVLPVDSPSYRNMMAKGGECAARAIALALHGVRVIDRGNSTSILTQAGTWARATNIHEFQIDINDLRYAS